MKNFLPVACVVATVVSAATALTAEQALCENLVVKQVQSTFAAFSFPDDSIPTHDESVAFCEHHSTIEGALRQVTQDQPHCTTHLDAADAVAQTQCMQVKCQTWFEESMDNDKTLSSLQDLQEVCKIKDQLIKSVDSMIQAHPECKEFVPLSADMIKKVCDVSANCVESVDASLAAASSSSVYAINGDWTSVCADKAAMTTALKAVISAKPECGEFLSEAQVAVENICIEKDCHEVISAAWSELLPELFDMDLNTFPSAEDQVAMCNDTGILVHGVVKATVNHTECLPYVTYTPVLVDTMCGRTRCLADVEDLLIKDAAVSAEVFPDNGQWFTSDTTADEMNVLCASKAAIAGAIATVTEADETCIYALTDAMEDLDTGCMPSLSQGSACDNCVVGVASLVRLLAKADNEGMAGRFAEDECTTKVQDVANTLAGCEDVCNADKAARSLAAAVVLDAGEGLSFGGKCDVTAVTGVVGLYDGSSDRPELSVGTIVGAIAGSVVGVAALVMVAIKNSKASAGRAQVGVVGVPTDARASKQMSANPLFDDL